MFLVKRGTIIQIEKPKVEGSQFFDWSPWKPYETTADRLYEKSDVWDAVAVANDRDDVPMWARRNITEHGYTVIKQMGKTGVKYAMVPSKNIEFLD